MDVGHLFAKYEVKPAIVTRDIKYREWVYSVAREININDTAEIALVRELSDIMQRSLWEYGWKAVSSNNLYWNGTDMPIRVILVPHPKLKGYNLTIANPQIKEYYGKPIEVSERCGSFPGNVYVVERSPFVKLSGYQLCETGFKPVELRYGSRVVSVYIYVGTHISGGVAKIVGKFLNLEERVTKSGYAQHEVDHLDGITIFDKNVTKRRNN